MTTFKKIISFGGMATVIMVANLMRTALDRIIVGKWVGLAQVAVYGLAAQFTEYVITVILQGMNVLTPRFASLEGKNDRIQIKKLFRTSLQISSFLAFGFYMGAILFGEDLIVLWVGTEFVEAKYVLWILMTGFVLDLAQNPGVSLMFALNKHQLYAWTVTAEALAKILISVMLVSRYGMIGAALGTAVPMVITRILVQPVYVARMLDMSVVEYGKPIVLQMSIAAVMVAAVSPFTLLDMRSHTLTGVIGWMTAVSALYCAASLGFMHKDQRRIVRESVFRILIRRKAESLL
jgi:O-antigen/teichoic acid export membrane protein